MLFLFLAGVKIPPPPPAQSFAKIAAKTPPPEEPKDEEPVATQKVEAPQKIEAPQPVKPNFPPLEEARDTNSPVTDLSDLPSAHDMLQEKSGTLSGVSNGPNC